MSEQIKPGQVWRRKSDGLDVTVIHVERGWVQFQGRTKSWASQAGFLRKYEKVTDD